MRMKRILKAVIFCIIICACLFYLSKVFTNSMSTMNEFYAQEENTLDGIYLGSSAAYNLWMATDAYDEYGMCIYNLGSPVQPLSLEKNLVEEALKDHPDMDLVVIELKNLVRETDDNNADVEGFIRTVTDPMHFSSNRTEAIDNALDYYQETGADINYDRMTYYFPLIYRHGKWAQDLTVKDLLLIKERKFYKGFSTSKGYKVQEMEMPDFYEGYTELSKADQRVIKDLLEYCQGIKQDVLFVAAPICVSDERYGKLNSAFRMCEEAGFPTLNFNEKENWDKLNLDIKKDFCDNTHLNLIGAEKATEVIAEYIHNNFEIEDHRGETGYESWDEEQDDLLKTMKQLKTN